jgi:hypothetical protein
MTFFKLKRGVKNIAIFGCGLVEFPEAPLTYIKTLRYGQLS